MTHTTARAAEQQERERRERSAIARVAHIAAAASLVVVHLACQPPAEGSVLLDLSAFASPDIPGLEDVSATLTVETTNGRPATLNVRTIDDDGVEEWRLVTSPVPMVCSLGFCDLDFTLDPGNYNAALDVFARDRCGMPAQVAAALPTAGNPVTVGGLFSLELGDVSYAFDDDGDGIENILEPVVCGRFDHDDRDRPAAFCANDDDACCAPFIGRDLVSRMASFDGGTLVRADGALVPVQPFLLDATEVTFGSFARCVAAGACLFGEPTHPVRQAAVQAQRDLPVVGLFPGEAQNYCAWLGKRLPLDAEWDFAASIDATGARAKLPFDPNAPEILLAQAGNRGGRIDDEGVAAACEPTNTRVAFNHRALGENCPQKVMGVGSYASSHNHRGRGSPLADMAGNVYEWTFDELIRGPVDPVIPPGVTRVRLRGGYYGSAPLLVENNYPVSVSVIDGDVDTNMVRLAPYLAITGFRCAVRADEAPLVSLEPLCPAQ